MGVIRGQFRVRKMPGDGAWFLCRKLRYFGRLFPCGRAGKRVVPGHPGWIQMLKIHEQNVDEKRRKNPEEILKKQYFAGNTVKIAQKECQASNKVEMPDLTNRFRSGKIIPRNGATDVAAFKFYLDEVKCRLSGRYGAGNGGLCRGTEQCPRWNGFRRNTMLGFHSRKSIVFDCGAPGAPQSRRPGCNAASAAAPKQEERSCLVSLP